MAGHAPVLEDGSLLSRLDRRFLRLERFFGLLSGLAVFSLMVLAVISVGGRNLMNAPLPGYVGLDRAGDAADRLHGDFLCPARGAGISAWIS